jgi:type III pantothenate kinase
VIGKGTVDAIRSGVVFGFAAAVDGLISRIIEELGEEATTIATGGLAGVVVPHAHNIDLVDDLLTLKGLKLLHERNA